MIASHSGNQFPFEGSYQIGIVHFQGPGIHMSSIELRFFHLPGWSPFSISLRTFSRLRDLTDPVACIEILLF